MTKYRVSARNLPEQISSIMRALLDVDLEIQDLKLTQILPFERKIDREIAFDIDLKNEAQRRARRCELEENSAYVEMLEHIARLESQKKILAIDVELLRMQFSRWKIEQKYMIASMALDTNE